MFSRAFALTAVLLFGGFWRAQASSLSTDESGTGSAIAQYSSLSAYASAQYTTEIGMTGDYNVDEGYAYAAFTDELYFSSISPGDSLTIEVSFSACLIAKGYVDVAFQVNSFPNVDYMNPVDCPQDQSLVYTIPLTSDVSLNFSVAAEPYLYGIPQFDGPITSGYGSASESVSFQVTDAAGDVIYLPYWTDSGASYADLGTAVPEPSTLLLLGSGFLVIARLRLKFAGRGC